jgi:hypothetical protein
MCGHSTGWGRSALGRQNASVRRRGSRRRWSLPARAAALLPLGLAISRRVLASGRAVLAASAEASLHTNNGRVLAHVDHRLAGDQLAAVLVGLVYAREVPLQLARLREGHAAQAAQVRTCPNKE